MKSDCKCNFYYQVQSQALHVFYSDGDAQAGSSIQTKKGPELNRKFYAELKSLEGQVNSKY